MKRTKRTKTSRHTNRSTSKKGMTSLQKARATQKAIKAKLANLKTEFKNKLQSAVQTAYQKALNDAVRLNEQRIHIRNKAIAIAEAKFDKKIAKTMLKKTKKTSKKRRKTTTTGTHHPSNTKRTTRRSNTRRTKRQVSRRTRKASR